MHIQHATKGDLPAILRIYADAREYMKRNGNPLQWGDTYPEETLLASDIYERSLYLCVENGEPIGVFYYRLGEDPTYSHIEQGAWKNDAPYGVIHRIATVSHRRGVASFCFAHCYKQCKNLKIDTHRDNLPMQRSLEKNGFSYCGIIHLENGEERLAYQKCEA